MKHSQTPSPKLLPRLSLEAAVGSGEEVEASSPKALQPHAASPLCILIKTLWAGLLVATAASVLIINYQSVLEPLKHARRLSPLSFFKFSIFKSPFRPRLFQGYWQTKGKLTVSLSQTIFKKIFFFSFLEGHSLHIINVSWILPSSFALFFFFLLWKIIQKYGYIQTGGGRRRAPPPSPESLISVGGGGGVSSSVTLSKS